MLEDTTTPREGDRALLGPPPKPLFQQRNRDQNPVFATALLLFTFGRSSVRI
jgi:hypothetical protein